MQTQRGGILIQPYRCLRVRTVRYEVSVKNSLIHLIIAAMIATFFPLDIHTSKKILMERLLCLVLKLYPWVNLNNGIRNVPGMKGTRVFVENK